MEQHDFTGLPHSMVEKALSGAQKIGTRLAKTLASMKPTFNKVREELERRALIMHDAWMVQPLTPTVSGIDGAFVIDETAAFDIVLCGALGVEGFCPHYGAVHWPEPVFEVHIGYEVHNRSVRTLIQALMTQMEVLIAGNAPHEVVLLDGSFVTPLVSVKKALALINRREHTSSSIVEKFAGWLDEFLSTYLSLLTISRSDKVVAAVPKQSVNRDFAGVVELPAGFKEKAVLNYVLRPGEFTKPLRTRASDLENNYGFTPSLGPQQRQLIRELERLCRDMTFLYYKPYPFVSPLRVEIPAQVAASETKLGLLLQAIKQQMTVPSVVEPYPLFLADQFVKRLSAVTGPFKQIVAYTASSLDGVEPQEVFAIINSYRTDVRNHKMEEKR